MTIHNPKTLRSAGFEGHREEEPNLEGTAAHGRIGPETDGAKRQGAMVPSSSWFFFGLGHGGFPRRCGRFPAGRGRFLVSLTTKISAVLFVGRWGVTGVLWVGGPLSCWAILLEIRLIGVPATCKEDGQDEAEQ